MARKDIPQGADNVLRDLGFDDAEELSAKAALALKFNSLLSERNLSQTEAAALTGMTQPKVSQVRRYKLQNISLERLMQALVSLDQRVEIVVQPASPPGAGARHHRRRLMMPDLADVTGLTDSRDRSLGRLIAM